MVEVIMPLTSIKLGMDASSLEHLRWLSDTDSQAPFVAMSFPKESIDKNFDRAVELYHALNDGVENPRVQPLLEICKARGGKDSLISVVLDFWGKFDINSANITNNAENSVNKNSNTNNTHSTAEVRYCGEPVNQPDTKHTDVFCCGFKVGESPFVEFERKKYSKKPEGSKDPNTYTDGMGEM